VALVHDVVEWAPVGPLDRGERAIGGGQHDAHRRLARSNGAATRAGLLTVVPVGDRFGGGDDVVPAAPLPPRLDRGHRVDHPLLGSLARLAIRFLSDVL
jgi:hypothetical protein